MQARRLLSIKIVSLGKYCCQTIYFSTSTPFPGWSFRLWRQWLCFLIINMFSLEYCWLQMKITQSENFLKVLPLLWSLRWWGLAGEVTEWTLMTASVCSDILMISAIAQPGSHTSSKLAVWQNAGSRFNYFASSRGFSAITLGPSGCTPSPDVRPLSAKAYIKDPRPPTDDVNQTSPSQHGNEGMLVNSWGPWETEWQYSAHVYVGRVKLLSEKQLFLHLRAVRYGCLFLLTVKPVSPLLVYSDSLHGLYHFEWLVSAKAT